MEIIICPDKNSADTMTANILAQRVSTQPSCLIGLATGRTVENVYSQLAKNHQENGLDFSKIKTVNLDEYVGLPDTHEQSYRYYMNERLFKHVNLRTENTHLPNGIAEDIPSECARYESLIQRLGGIEIQLLGIGSDGHIGFNEPGSSLVSRTRIKTLTRETVEQNGLIFGDESLVPRHALTMGVGTIMDAREVLLLATGESKAQIVSDAFEGALTSWVTASILQMHPRATVVLDEAAASKLKNYDYYKWAYDNKPNWQKEL